MGRSQRDYWHFYWPLALVGIVFLVGRLVQNRVLLGFERGVKELAVFTLAQAAFGPFRAPLIFVPQMANVLVRGPQSFRSCVRFLATICLIFTVPVVLLGWTPLGTAILPHLYEVDAERVAHLQGYLRYFAPLIAMAGATGLLTGLLVQSGWTGTVTLLRVAYVGLLVGLLTLGVRAGMTPINTIGLSMLLAGVGHLVLTGVLYARCAAERRPDGDRPLRQGEIAGFFLPILVTTVFFSITRPIIFRFLTGLNPTGDPALPDTDAMVAAVGLAFSFAMLFHSPINQFRNVLVTFGHEDMAGVRRFMRRVTACVIGLMLLCVITPFARLFLIHAQDARGEVLTMARQAIWPLCCIPLVMALRNYSHGSAMVRRRTWPMVVGGMARNLSVVVGAPVLVALGLYNHVAATAMLVLAFASEATGVRLFSGAHVTADEPDSGDGDGDGNPGQDGA